MPSPTTPSTTFLPSPPSQLAPPTGEKWSCRVHPKSIRPLRGGSSSLVALVPAAMELLSRAPVLSCGAKRGSAGSSSSSPMGPLMGALGRWIYRAVKPPPPPRICGAPGGPPVTAPRVTLRDGRHLAYAESGVRKEDARFKVVFSHGFSGSRLDTLRASPVSCRPPRFSGALFVGLQCYPRSRFRFYLLLDGVRMTSL